jgi:hypothetical protein
MDPKLIEQNDHRAEYRYGHDFVPLILERISWCKQHNIRTSEEALTGLLTKKYTSAKWSSNVIDAGIRYALEKLYKKRQIFVEDGFLEITQEPKYPLRFFTIHGAITLTILDFFKMRETAPSIKRIRPPKEEGDPEYRMNSSIKKQHLINYISTRRKPFKPDIVECAIDKLIDRGILLCYEPAGSIVQEECDEDKEFEPYHGGDGTTIPNELMIKDIIPGPYADDYKEQFRKIGL